MRSIWESKAALLAAGVMLASATVGFAPAAWAFGRTCSNINVSNAVGTGLSFPSATVGTYNLTAGDVLTLATTATAAGPVMLLSARAMPPCPVGRIR